MPKVKSAVLLASLLAWSGALRPAEPAPADLRAVTVESTLKDLSQANDAAIRHGHVTAVPGRDTLGRPRTDLIVDPPPETASLVQGEVQSSLHKLRRETAHRATPDGRQARVEDSLDRAAEAAGTDH